MAEFDWGAFTLFLYIVMRMAGFILFSPIFGRNGVSTAFQAGLAAALAAAVYLNFGGTVPVPETLLELGVRLLMELTLGLAVGLVMRFFFYIPDQAGEVVDTQMGMSMARTYDQTSQSNSTVTANLLNLLALELFFAENGHVTLVRLMMTSGQLVPFGTVSFGQDAAAHALELFADCVLLSVKLSFPILGAELLGQVGMGVLMKVIPQINVFAINIELKVIIGMAMLVLLITPISSFLLDAERMMLIELRRIIMLIGAAG